MASQADYCTTSALMSRLLLAVYGRSFPKSTGIIKQYVFPLARLSPGRDGVLRCCHISPKTLKRVVKAATRLAGLAMPASRHPFRHSFATHLLQSSYDIRTVQELLEHKDVKTVMIYTHSCTEQSEGILNRAGLAVRSWTGRGLISLAKEVLIECPVPSVPLAAHN